MNIKQAHIANKATPTEFTLWDYKEMFIGWQPEVLVVSQQICFRDILFCFILINVPQPLPTEIRILCCVYFFFSLLVCISFLMEVQIKLETTRDWKADSVRVKSWNYKNSDKNWEADKFWCWKPSGTTSFAHLFQNNQERVGGMAMHINGITRGLQKSYWTWT